MLTGVQPSEAAYTGPLEVEFLISLHSWRPFDPTQAGSSLAHSDRVVMTFKRDPTQDYWVNITRAEWAFKASAIVEYMGMWSNNVLVTTVALDRPIMIGPSELVVFEPKKVTAEGLSQFVDPAVLQKAVEAKQKEEKDLEKEFEKIRQELAKEWRKKSL